MGCLRASALEIDLVPPQGGWMTGFAARAEPSLGIHDPLMARALLLDDGTTRLAIVSCDLLGFSPEDVLEMRERIAGRGILPAHHILITCTHTHSGPASMPMRGVLGYVDARWLGNTKDRIVELVGALPARLRPARLSHAVTTISDIGHNRQDPSHPLDETLIAIGIDDRDDQRSGPGRTSSAIATVVNYATHAVVLGPRNRLYSGDFPGAVARHVAALRGGVGLYLQGACGDVDPVVYRERGWGTGTFEDTEQIGLRLAEATGSILKDAPRTDEVLLGAVHKTVAIPLAPPPPGSVLAQLVSDWNRQKCPAPEGPRDRAGELVATAMLEWAQQVQQARAEDRLPRALHCEILAARLNEVRLVALPFETYTEIGLGIKCDVSPLRGVVMGYTNGLYGYFPTRRAQDQGGYGADSSSRWFPALLTPIGYGAEDLLIAEASALAMSL